ncbi:hypothetical protein KFK09_019538 [Dendrobium nobile]|uniref:Uncharacterized protein n=1 Tax=Dendrobium nobile TaxID=94219 RepID=A0A8T3ARD9_DENNO|nr:hypothetical protein KFK09_019538 [Dendrobium nobile]
MPERPLATLKKKPTLYRTFGQPMKGQSVDRFNKKLGAGPSLQPWQSLPSDFRFICGSPSEEGAEPFNIALIAEGKDNVNVKGTTEMCNISTCMEEEVVNVCASVEEDADVFIRMNNELTYS